MQEAVLFASCYEGLVYFAHALEILLHGVLEEEADALLDQAKSSPQPQSVAVFANDTPVDTSAPAAEVEVEATGTAVLPRVVEFLDHFDECLQVVVGCARKTEIARWKYLFDVAGNPRQLFEVSISMIELHDANNYNRNVSMPKTTRLQPLTF